MHVIMPHSNTSRSGRAQLQTHRPHWPLSLIYGGACRMLWRLKSRRYTRTCANGRAQGLLRSRQERSYD